MKHYLVLALVSLLVACGGGSSSGSQNDSSGSTTSGSREVFPDIPDSGGRPVEVDDENDDDQGDGKETLEGPLFESLIATEVSEESGYASYILTLAVALDVDLLVNVWAFSVYGEAGEDYENVESPMVIKAGETQLRIDVPLIDDDQFECNESIALNVSADVDSLLEPLPFIVNDPDLRISALTFIEDNDLGPEASFLTSSISVPENIGTLDIPIELSDPACGTFKFIAGFESGTATAGEDIEGYASAWVLHGTKEATLSIEINDDVIAENDETLTIKLTTLNEEVIYGEHQSLELTIQPVIVETNASAYNACVRIADNGMKCWGEGEYFSFATGMDKTLGDDEGEMGSNLPFSQFGDGTLKYAAATQYLGCALFDDGQVKCAGDKYAVGLNDLSADPSEYVGDDASELGDELSAVDLGTGLTVSQLSVGHEYACAVFDNGRLKCWGANRDGQLGLGDRLQRGDDDNEMGDALPYVDVGSAGDGTPYTVKHVVTGWDITCAILQNDRMKCWGDNSESQLGYGDFDNRGDGPDEMGNNLPFIDLGTGRTVKKAFVYLRHVCAILDNDALKCWGYNEYGQIGLGKDDMFIGDDVHQASSYVCHEAAHDVVWKTEAIPPTEEGCQHGGIRLIYALDTNDNGIVDDAGTTYPLGDGCHRQNTTYLYDVTELSVGSATCPLGGFQYTAGFDSNGDGNHTGADEYEMGDNLPALDFGDGVYAVDMMVGENHSCALLSDNTTKCWGDNRNGQLGVDKDYESWGTAANETPVNQDEVDLGEKLHATDVFISYDLSCAVLNNHRVKCWGSDGGYGTMGNPDTVDHSIGDGKTEDGDPVSEMGDNLPYLELF